MLSSEVILAARSVWDLKPAAGPFSCGICRSSTQTLLCSKYMHSWGSYCPRLDRSDLTPTHWKVCCAVHAGVKRLCVLQALKGVNVTMRKPKISWCRNNHNGKQGHTWAGGSYLRLTWLCMNIFLNNRRLSLNHLFVPEKSLSRISCLIRLYGPNG